MLNFSDFSNVIITLISAGAGFSAALLIQRQKQKIDRNNDLIGAYTEWFTAEDRLCRKSVLMFERIKGFPIEIEFDNSTNDEIKELIEDFYLLTKAMNKIILIESRKDIKESLHAINKMINRILDSLSFAENHYRENIKFNRFYSISNWPIDLRNEWIERKEKFMEHEKNCPIKSGKTAEDMSKICEEIQKMCECLKLSISKGF